MMDQPTVNHQSLPGPGKKRDTCMRFIIMYTTRQGAEAITGLSCDGGASRVYVRFCLQQHLFTDMLSREGTTGGGDKDVRTIGNYICSKD